MKKYYKFIEKCKHKNPTLFHKHHIIPRAMGGTDDTTNIIKLGYEDHQTAHLLLAESFPLGSENRKKNMLAVQLLNSYTQNPDVMANGWKHSEETKQKMRGKRGSYTNKPDYVNPFKDKTHTKEHREYISKLNSKTKFEKIQQFTKDDTLICEYTSISDVIEQNPSFKKAAISNVLNGYSKTSYKCKWRYLK